MVNISASRKISLLVIHIFLAVFGLICIIPLIAVISISLSDEAEIVNSGYSLIPNKISTMAYDYIFQNPAQIINSYKVSIIVTVIGLTAGLLMTSMIAYTLSRRDFKYRNALSIYVFITMLFGGGLVPFYILVKRYLHMDDKIWALIVPYLISPWNILLLRTFFQKIPVELIESAKIDGAREFRIFFAMILPLSKPALGTIGLFIALGYWNDWWLGLLFINKAELLTLQVLLQRIMANIDFLKSNMINAVVDLSTLKNLPGESARMAMCILAAGPMLIMFPFFQKFFIKGLTIGSIKG